jgi:MoaA/NifB/PqqE/SkfB family radical SAM enzyme
MTFLTFTSGLLLDDATCDRLAKLGNVIPCISCEGFEEETDKRRGPGAFRKIVCAMNRLRDKGVVFGFSATVTSENAERVTSNEFIDFYAEQGCLIGWYFTYIPIGRKPALELMPKPEQRAMVGRRVREIRATKEIFVVDFWNDGEHAGGCIAGARKYFHVNNRGDVEPCVFCHFATDNIREKPLREILGSPFFRAIRSRQPYHKDLRRPCILIDAPAVLREVVAETGAHPTHPGAESILTTYAQALDEYTDAFGKVLKGEKKSDWVMHI